MPDTNALTLAILRTAVLGRRFPAASQSTNATRWLASAYQDVWSASDWQFKRVSREALPVVAGSSSPTMPAAFADATSLFDDAGDEVPRMGEETFESAYGHDFADSWRGTVEAFTVVNRQILLGPAPSSSSTFSLSYRRRMAHKQSDGITVAAGFMNEETDYPIWDDHHAILIPRAAAIGLQELSDPTWQIAQSEYERELERMLDDYATPLVGQWGDGWYA